MCTDELSETLNRLGRYLGIATSGLFRNVLRALRIGHPAMGREYVAGVGCRGKRAIARL
jgi:hypothetical protein